MRHCKKKGRLNRRTSWRKATLKSMANDLFTYQRIETTITKAKALRSFAEPLITMAKKNPGSINARRQAFQKLCDKSVVKSLFDDIAPLYKDIAGGYTRIIALGSRRGDGAQMAIMELTKRTISDEKLLGAKAGKAKPKKKVKPEKEQPEKKLEEEEKAHAAPEVDIAKKEERSVEDTRKEKAKTEQKKLTEKGLFKRFRRKKIG